MHRDFEAWVRMRYGNRYDLTMDHMATTVVKL